VRETKTGELPQYFLPHIMSLLQSQSSE